MLGHGDANAYLAALGQGSAELARAAHECLVSVGCSSYVKTIYIGYDLEGEMVAALYAHAHHLEIALALPEEVEGELVVDAGHLTWRTLPVAAILRRPADLKEFAELVAQATHRVQSRQHDVIRDNDYFAQRRARRRSP